LEFFVDFLHRHSPAAGRIPTSARGGPFSSARRCERGGKKWGLKKGILTGESRFFVWIMRGEFLIMGRFNKETSIGKSFSCSKSIIDGQRQKNIVEN
jgi:hypothetical protein